MLDRLIFIALFTYILWGTRLAVLCRPLGGGGPVPGRLANAALASTALTPLFAPVMYGTEGFAFMAPLPFLLVDSAHSHVFAGWIAATWLFSFVVALWLGKRVPDE